MPQIEIHFKGGAGTDWSEWLQGCTVQPVSQDEMCLCSDAVDNSAIYGILSTLGSLGITLISVLVYEKQEIRI